jgi:hypothetical protein
MAPGSEAAERASSHQRRQKALRPSKDACTDFGKALRKKANKTLSEAAVVAVRFPSDVVRRVAPPAPPPRFAARKPECSAWVVKDRRLGGFVFLLKSKSGRAGTGVEHWVAIPEDTVDAVTASPDREGQLQELYDKLDAELADSHVVGFTLKGLPVDARFWCAPASSASSAVAAVQLAAEALPVALYPAGSSEEEDSGSEDLEAATEMAAADSAPEV